jgi:hypothetical protein
LRFDTNQSWIESDGASAVHGQWTIEVAHALRARETSEIALSHSASPARRAAWCPCASGLRFKHCCGWEPSNSVAGDAVVLETERQAALLQRADALVRRGAATRAATILGSLRPDMLSALQNRDAGEMCVDLDMLEQGRAFLQRSLEVDSGDASAAESMDDCRHLMQRPAEWTAASRSLIAQLDALNSRARTVSNIRQLHIVCKLDALGGTESRAMNLYRRLSALAPTTLWSTRPVLAAHVAWHPVREITADAFPAGGTLVIVGTYYECGVWLETQAFDRIVVCHNLSEQHISLGQRLHQIEKNASRPQVRLTFPSALFKTATGLPGTVEYSPIDLAALRCRAVRSASRKLTVGRHGRAHPMKFHPNDPSFFRTIMARGHAVKILGGTQIAPAFAYDVAHKPELLPVGAQNVPAFLESLDVFVHRTHPHFLETGGTVILEAMAMELPVIVFAERCGSVELI